MRFKLSLAALFFAQTVAFADVLTHKNGQQLEGVITSEDGKQVVIEVEGMEMPFSRAEIDSIVRGPVKPKTAVKKETPAEKAATSPVPESAPSVDYSKLEKPVLMFDERNWKLGFQNAQNNQLIAQFLLEGETLKNWTELVTAQLWIGLRADPKHYVEYVKKESKSRCPGAVWNMLSESPTDMMYEWSVRDCAGVPDQTEIARVHLGEDGTHVLHYAVKTGEISPEERQKWTKSLRESQFVR